MKAIVSISTAILGKTSLILFFIFFVLSLSIKDSNAITRSDFQHKVENIVTEELLKHVDTNDSDQLKRVEERGRLISEIVHYYPYENLSDDMANWIEQSIIALVHNRANVLATDEVTSAKLIADLDNRAKMTIAKLSPDLLPILKRRSENWLQAASQYRKERDLFLIEYLSKGQILKINIGHSVVNGGDSFIRTVAAMDINLMPKNYPFGSGNNLVDLSGSNIDSMLLTCAFIRQIHNHSIIVKKGDNLAYRNLLTVTLYMPDAKFYDFSTVKPKVEQLLNVCVSKNDSITEINYDGILDFLMKSDLLHWMDWQKVIEPNSKIVPPPVDPGDTAYVVFKNDAYPWEALKDIQKD